MSIQGPKYKPSQQYFLAALDLRSATLDEITACATSIPHIEMYGDWYKEILSSEYQKMNEITKYPRHPTHDREVINKIIAITNKYLNTEEIIEYRLAQSLLERVNNYTLFLQKTPDKEIVASHSIILKSYAYFRGYIDEWTDDFNSQTSTQCLTDISHLIDGSDSQIQLRIWQYERKHKISSTLPSLLSCQKIGAQAIPIHMPTTHYYVVKALYRKARLNELRYCLKLQENIQTYAGWFLKKLEEESLRINALKISALKGHAPIQDQILTCKKAFSKLKTELDKRLTLPSSNKCPNLVCRDFSSTASFFKR